MKKWKLYQYDKCSTCKKALQFLNKHEIEYESIDIKTQAPTRTELRRMLQYLNGDLKKLFNTSGIQYRELQISEKLKSLSSEEAIQLLSENGMLVKRPFLLGDGFGGVGFKEPEWKKFGK
jgi:Spx/MgsR family transcriptional regulator